MSRIAVLGTGRMGSAVAQVLAENGHDVVGWNRTRQRAKALETAGVTVEPTPAAAADRADIVITLLSDYSAVDSALNGHEGALSTMGKNTVLAQMSTIGPVATESLTQQIPAHVDVLDMPVMGSVPQIHAGRLVMLAAGDSDVISRVNADFGCLGNLKPCGQPPSGSALKVLMNAAMISSVVAVNDMYTLGRRLGLSEEVLTDSIKSGPLSMAVNRSLATDAQFPIGMAIKDLDLAIGGTRDLPIITTARDQLATHENHSADLSAAINSKP